MRHVSKVYFILSSQYLLKKSATFIVRPAQFYIHYFKTFLEEYWLPNGANLLQIEHLIITVNSEMAVKQSNNCLR